MRGWTAEGREQRKQRRGGEGEEGRKRGDEKGEKSPRSFLKDGTYGVGRSLSTEIHFRSCWQ